MSSNPVIYIGVVTYNSARVIRACLRALLSQSYQPVVIVVLDNNSSDKTCDIVRSYPRVRLVEQKINSGFGSAHNAIISSLKMRDTDYYLAVNPDAILSKTYCAGLVAGCQKHKASWGTGKLYRNTKKKILYSVGHAIFWDGYAINIGYIQKDSGQYDAGREVFGAPGAAVMYKGDLIRSISYRAKFFDPSFFMYYEDVDVDWRAHLAGYHCWYEPSAIAEHVGGTPLPHFKAEALCNRFLSVVKNATTKDLFIKNIPIMLLHMVFRFVLSPSVGTKLVYLFFMRLPNVILYRLSQRENDNTDMHAWFDWSKSEVSGQPTSAVERIRAFASA